MADILRGIVRDVLQAVLTCLLNTSLRRRICLSRSAACTPGLLLGKNQFLGCSFPSPTTAATAASASEQKSSQSSIKCMQVCQAPTPVRATVQASHDAPHNVLPSTLALISAV